MTYAYSLTALDLNSVIEFDNPDKTQVYTKKALLKAVLHDEKGTFIRYKDLTRPNPMEYAHYIDQLVEIKLTPIQGSGTE